MSSDNLMTIRKSGKGALTATEAASTNTQVLPPGLYDIEVVVPIAATGTTPACTLDVKDSPDGTTFTSLVDARARALPTAAGRFFLRGVRIVQWANGSANVGVTLTVTGTTPSFGAVSIQAYPVGATSSWNGNP